MTVGVDDCDSAEEGGALGHIPHCRLISDKDLQLIRRYDKASRETQTSLLNEVSNSLTF